MSGKARPLVAWTIALLALAALANDPAAGADGSPGTPQQISFPSSSPFLPSEIASAPDEDAQGTLVMPARASADRPVPAVVLLHGTAEYRAVRELDYARRLAEAGYAALAIDSFGARRDRWSGFTDHLLNVTESMMLADAYAALAWLAARPDIDGSRIALVGFSYGGMVATFAAHRQIAAAFAPDGPWFAAHVSYYAPCIARFADPRTTGAPVHISIGGRDDLTPADRCREIVEDLRAGGSEVTFRIHPDGLHQWDVPRGRPRRMGMSLADCRLGVSPDGGVRDRRTGLPMLGPVTRRLILAACVDRNGYLIGGDPDVKAASDKDLLTFLSRALD